MAQKRTSKNQHERYESLNVIIICQIITWGNNSFRYSLSHTFGWFWFLFSFNTINRQALGSFESVGRETCGFCAPGILGTSRKGDQWPGQWTSPYIYISLSKGQICWNCKKSPMKSINTSWRQRDISCETMAAWQKVANQKRMENQLKTKQNKHCTVYN